MLLLAGTLPWCTFVLLSLKTCATQMWPCNITGVRFFGCMFFTQEFMCHVLIVWVKIAYFPLKAVMWGQKNKPYVVLVDQSLYFNKSNPVKPGWSAHNADSETQKWVKFECATEFWVWLGSSVSGQRSGERLEVGTAQWAGFDDGLKHRENTWTQPLRRRQPTRRGLLHAAKRVPHMGFQQTGEHWMKVASCGCVDLGVEDASGSALPSPQKRIQNQITAGGRLLTQCCCHFHNKSPFRAFSSISMWTSGCVVCGCISIGKDPAHTFRYAGYSRKKLVVIVCDSSAVITSRILFFFGF